MLLTRRSEFTKKTNTIELPLTEAEFNTAELNWRNGMLIQNAFPTLTPSQREFIKTGVTEEEWDEAFSEEEEN